MDQIPHGQPQQPLQPLQPQPQPQMQMQPQGQYAPPPPPPPPPPIVSAQTLYQQQPQPQPAQHEYQKLGGFLRIIVILAVAGATRSIFRTFQEFGSDIEFVSLLFAYGYGFQGILFIVASVLLDVSVVITIVSMFLLATKKSGFFLLFILSNLAGFLGILLLFVQSLFLFAKEIEIILMGVFLVLALLQLVLFGLYFIKSVRVRTFMGTDAYITKNPLTRWARPPVPAVPDPVPLPNHAGMM